MSSGAYLGGALGHGPPPLDRQDSIISIEKYAKLWHGPPFVTWAEGLSTETVGKDVFLAKTGLNLSEFFFFWSSPNFGQKNGFGFWLENFQSGLHKSQSFWSSSFQNPAYATGCR